MLDLADLMHLDARLVDDEGRPLAERRAPAELRAGVEMETATSPYAGSRHRHEKQMNASALKQLRRCWPDVVRTFASLRGHAPARDRVTLLDFHRTTVRALMLPSFLLHARGGSPRVPAGVAAVYKASLGLVTAAQAMLTHALLAGEPPDEAEPDAWTILRFAESAGLLIGREEVCAAPPLLILELLEVLTGPAMTAAAIPGVDDPPRYLAYADLAQRMYLLELVFPLVIWASPEAREPLRRMFALLATPEREAQAAAFFEPPSMELHLFQAMVRKLADRSPGETARAIDAAWRCLKSVDPEEEIRRRFEEPAAAGEEREPFTRTLAIYRDRERRKRTLHRGYFREMNALLGRADPGRDVLESTITRAFDRKLRDAIESAQARSG